MAKIMDPVLPILSLFWDIGPLFWALLEVPEVAIIQIPFYLLYTSIAW